MLTDCRSEKSHEG